MGNLPLMTNFLRVEFCFNYPTHEGSGFTQQYMNDYKPYSLNDIFDIMEIKEDNWDYRIFKELENV